MPSINNLTDSKCRAARAGEKAQKLFDGGNLYLYVTPKGAKIWQLAYRIDGKQQQISLGAFPLVFLSDARARRDEIKAKLIAGADPMRERKAKKITISFEGNPPRVQAFLISAIKN